jgi:Domain of unknown function (DUF4386)
VLQTRQHARVAGWLYLLLALIGPIGLLYVPGKLIVPENATATAANVRASEWLLRLGIVSDLAHQIVFIFLVLALHRLLKGVNEAQARLMVILALLSVPIVFVNSLNAVAALVLVSGGDFLAVFEGPQRDALAYLFLQLNSQGIVVASVFWGLWLLPFGILVIRSGFAPRILGILLIVAGVAYVVSSFATLGLPVYGPRVAQVVSPLVAGELPIIFWLLIWGSKGRGDAGAVGAA